MDCGLSDGYNTDKTTSSHNFPHTFGIKDNTWTKTNDEQLKVGKSRK